ncbi:MAG: CehA/McbA family metallohydrolase, partial [Micromonosporaceae bacterium]|nr:CehA/McbA family metallohydrolase [Micromonosporaceae bacterium]
DATRGTGWYRGDLHLHTVHSDGQRTPAELAAAARAAGLDFIASTDHNTSAANRAWSQLRYEGLTVLPGQEVTTRHGHWLAIGTPTGCSVDWRYSPRDGVFAGHARQVRERGGLVVAAHPAVPLPSAAWEFGFRHVDAVEVWNGRWGVDDEATLRLWHRLLRRGQRVAAVGGSDSHTPRQPVGRPQTVVHATDLSTPALLAGLRQGRSYLAESSGVVLRLAARPLSAAGTPAGAQVGTQPRAEIGEALRLPSGTRILVTASVTGVPGTRLTLLTAAGRLASTRISAAGTHHLHAIVDSGVARFVRAEVRRGAHRGVPAPMVALSNPVWLLAG